MKRLAPCLVFVLALGFLSARAQEREDRTLLTWAQMRAIINEASGERAMHHVLELVPYPRVRSRAEYTGHFRESEVMARFAQEYGFANIEIESFPSQGPSWYASQAELWMIEPELRKLYDVYDVAISIASGSESGDVTAEVVDVGIGGRQEDYAGKDVKGKIVLGSTGAGTLQRLGVFERDAAGVLSYNSLRPDSYPDQIASQSVAANAPAGKKPGFGWSIAPRVAREIAARVGRGEKVVLRSIVRSETFPGELETVHAVIPGDGSTNQDVIISGHLYEGYLKQGANDDNSGCAVTLEMGRTLIRLIGEGKLPRPKRNIHFLWVPEISGTNAWLRKHEDIKKRIIADLNFDMEGIRLSTSASFFVLHRTPDTFPTFLNDVAESVLRFVADTNRERVRYRANGYRFTLPIVAPNGSQDPFYLSVEKHYGSSDHVTYMQHGIPSVMFITWPDMWYHSSEDTPDKQDPTQYKRVAVVGAGAATVLAVADDEMAARVAGESLARGAERMGDSHRKGLSYMADVMDGTALLDAYKEARVAIRHQAGIEKAVVRSSAVLFSNAVEAERKLAPFEALIEQRAAALQNEVKAYYALQAAQRKLTLTEPTPADAERLAARLVPERAAAPGGGGFGGGGGGGGGAFGGGAQLALQRLAPEERAAVQAVLRKVPQHMTAELNVLINQKRTCSRSATFSQVSSSRCRWPS